ncbi:LOW QUALITY PROTEIN: histone H1.8 [Falco cherrug]|uniref:LOW QUALITY PROTEIN: histone H1.8 n=1 Tax=Falco cherrug TaxID=345164 RepID=UPI002479F46F|nr:LOW QUALITY PROTEIN: histone H1.8 [Falco cherrug]
MEPELAEAAGTAQLPHLPAQGRQPRRPSTLHMVTEALQAQDERKGASIVATKRFILAKYPTVDPGHLGDLLKQALSKGLSCGDLVRPHNSSAMGATGLGLGAEVPPPLAPLPPLLHPQLAPEKLWQKQTMDQVDPIRGQVPKVGRKGTPGMHSSPTRSDGAKPPGAACQPRAPSKGHSGSPVALKVRGGGGGGGEGSPGGAGAKGSRAALVGKSRAKAPRGARQDTPKAKGDQGKARKPRGTPETGQGRPGCRVVATPLEGRQGL